MTAYEESRKAILHYYSSTRQVGHTQFMIDGLVAWIRVNHGHHVVVLAGHEAGVNELRRRVIDAVRAAGINYRVSSAGKILAGTTDPLNTIRFCSVWNADGLFGLNAIAAVDNHAVISIMQRYEGQLTAHEANAKAAQEHIKDLEREVVETRHQVEAARRVSFEYALRVENRDARIAELEAKLELRGTT